MSSTEPNDADVRASDWIYVRTAKGHASARAAETTLPRIVKTLLIAVDGRTSVGMFQQLLTNFGDIPALFSALESGGFVERAAPANGAAGGSTAFSEADRRSKARLGTAADRKPAALARNSSAEAAASRFQATQNFAAPLSRFTEPSAFPAQSGFAGHSVFPASNLTAMSQLNSNLAMGEKDFPPTVRQRVSNVLASGHRSAVGEAARVRDARTLMSDFIYENFPDVAMEAVLALERLETTEQVLANLNEYQRLIGSAGRKASEHLLAVRRVLAS